MTINILNENIHLSTEDNWIGEIREAGGCRTFCGFQNFFQIENPLNINLVIQEKLRVSANELVLNYNTYECLNDFQSVFLQ